MIIKIKKYVAIVSNFVEHKDGSITKELSEVEIKGARISNATVLKQIPRTATLIEHGYRTSEFEVDADELERWLFAHGRLVENTTPPANASE